MASSHPPCTARLADGRSNATLPCAEVLAQRSVAERSFALPARGLYPAPPNAYSLFTVSLRRGTHSQLPVSPASPGIAPGH